MTNRVWSDERLQALHQVNMADTYKETDMTRQHNMDDQENIKRIREVDSRTRMIKKGRAEEWEQIHLEMEAGSDGLTKKINYFEDRSPLALILQELREELQSQGDAVAEFEKQDWDDQAEYIAQGWCEALEFAIKLIDGHTK